jgi:hypothetical protein
MKTLYEIFNFKTGEWDKRSLSEEEFSDKNSEDLENYEALNAEYDIVCEIIDQNISECGNNLKDLN